MGNNDCGGKRRKNLITVLLSRIRPLRLASGTGEQIARIVIVGGGKTSEVLGIRRTK